jgi:WhiB family redox-sensing transcriptional regulator
MPQYAEAVLEQNLSIEVTTEQSPGLAPEASGAALLIAKRQAILERIAYEQGARPKIRIDWRDHLREAEVTLSEAQQKLATFVLGKEEGPARQREATSAALFLRWFAAEGQSIRELNASKRSLISPMYKAVRELTPEVIDPALEPDYSIDPAIIQELSSPILRAPNRSHGKVSQPTPRPSIPSDWVSEPVDLGMPHLRYEPDVDNSNPLAWQGDALCAQTDPEAFFPEKGGSTRDAKRICTTCEVKHQCLEYALENDERFGIWGGLSERERRKLRRGRSI